MPQTKLNSALWLIKSVCKKALGPNLWTRIWVRAIIGLSKKTKCQFANQDEKGNSKRTSGYSLSPLGAHNRVIGAALQMWLTEVKLRLRSRLYTIRAFLNPKVEIFWKPVGIFSYLNISSCFVREFSILSRIGSSGLETLYNIVFFCFKSVNLGFSVLHYFQSKASNVYQHF